MATNKFFKSLLFALTIAINLFSFCAFKSHQHIQFLHNKIIQIHVQQMEN
jgi:hypothetical protein